MDSVGSAFLAETPGRVLTPNDPAKRAKKARRARGGRIEFDARALREFTTGAAARNKRMKREAALRQQAKAKAADREKRRERLHAKRAVCAELEAHKNPYMEMSVQKLREEARKARKTSGGGIGAEGSKVVSETKYEGKGGRKVVATVQRL